MQLSKIWVNIHCVTGKIRLYLSIKGFMGWVTPDIPALPTLLICCCCCTALRRNTTLGLSAAAYPTIVQSRASASTEAARSPWADGKDHCKLGRGGGGETHTRQYCEADQINQSISRGIENSLPDRATRAALNASHTRKCRNPV